MNPLVNSHPISEWESGELVLISSNNEKRIGTIDHKLPNNKYSVSIASEIKTQLVHASTITSILRPSFDDLYPLNESVDPVVRIR